MQNSLPLLEDRYINSLFLMVDSVCRCVLDKFCGILLCFLSMENIDLLSLDNLKSSSLSVGSGWIGWSKV